MRSSICLLGLLLLAGCASPSVSMTPTAPPTATNTPAPTITPSPTFPPPEIRTTVLEAGAPIVCPTPEPDYDETVLAPDVSALRWEQVAGQPSLYKLTCLTSAPNAFFYAEASPDGRWLPVYLGNGPAGEMSRSQALYIIDTEGGQHWVASTRHGLGGPSLPTYYAWLPDGRLVWVDDYKLYIAPASGENPVQVNGPERVSEVWAVSNKMLFASGLTRIDLASGQWDRAIENIDYSYSNIDLFSLSPDGSYAAVYANGALWKVPMEVGKPPEHIVDIKLEYSRWPARPEPFGDSPYWYPGGFVATSDDRSSWVNSMVDTRDGSVTPIDDLIAPYRLVESRGWPYSLSSDGKWFRMFVTTPDHPHDRKTYIAPVSDFNAGWLLPDDVGIAWGEDGPSYYVRREQTADGYRDTTLSAVDGHPVLIWDFKLPEPDERFGFYVQDYLVRYLNRIYVLDGDGAPVQHIDLPIPQDYYYNINVDAVSQSKLLISGVEVGPDCTRTPALWMWRLNE